MKKLFEYFSKHQAGVLSVSLTLMFSFSIISLVESFNRIL